MITAAIDISDGEADAVTVESELTWFKVYIGEVELIVSLAQLEAMHAAIAPLFVEQPAGGEG